MRRRQALALLGGTVLAGTVGATGAVGQAYAADEVYFQNRGSVEGWDYAYTQKDGVIATVDSPVYKGAHCLQATQTYIGETGGYHSEVIQRGAQSVGEDKYYGQAIRLAPGWEFHDQNVTFQQWSPEAPEGPWLLMFVIGDEIRFGGSGGIKGTVGSITALRGTWLRVVTRLKPAGNSAGAFEVWLNGRKTVSMTGIAVLPSTSRTIRWSNGIYCTAWRDGTPSGPDVLTIHHDNHRIASSYALAEPANWS
ncbi:polysaccharide lyase [Streptomyces soliscabiei]|uniref:polysaccharide lyase n=1 Tax=Streptomyces soliscabiei TaxID=588897 RepID=UPI0029A51DC3|nr:polysaccharide lyase [Streptomyces sp. NY05-11A]MDX2682643.1 polysaccharide lyase [Streptomyces sp. NY05-11A]